jgi:hypothetical protein
MEKVVSVRLVPKSLKGKNRIREAKTDRWDVVREGAFQGAPALLVQPPGNPNMLRWVLVVGDRDFEATDHATEPTQGVNGN